MMTNQRKVRVGGDILSSLSIERLLAHRKMYQRLASGNGTIWMKGKWQGDLQKIDAEIALRGDLE